MKNTILSIQKGQFFSLVAEKSASEIDAKYLKKKSNLRGRVTSVTTYAHARICDYEHLAEVKEKRAEGIAPTKPIWWAWQTFPYIAYHKSNFKEYAVLKSAEVHTQYYLDGQPIRKSDYADDFLAKKKEESTVYMVALGEIVSVTAEKQTHTKRVSEVA